MMHTYVAFSGGQRTTGGLTHCLAWATTLVGRNRTRIVRVLKVRAGQRYGRIAFEVSADGVRPIRRGRLCQARIVVKAARHG